MLGGQIATLKIPHMFSFVHFFSVCPLTIWRKERKKIEGK